MNSNESTHEHWHASVYTKHPLGGGGGAAPDELRDENNG